jgi:hypothetical protein
MRRVPSEAREAGMISLRRCPDCGVALASDEMQCIDCRPYLRPEARLASEQKRELVQAEREIESLGNLLKRMHQKTLEDKT